MSSIDELTERGVALARDLGELTDKYGDDQSLWPAGVRTRADNLSRGLRAIDDDIRVREMAQQRTDDVLSRIRSGELTTERAGDVGPIRSRSNPWKGLDEHLRNESPAGYRQRALDVVELVPGIPTSNRAMLAESVDADVSGRTGMFLTCAADPDYLSAFRHLLADPVGGHRLWTEPERLAYSRTTAMRAALSLTDANGGYLVPAQLDDRIMILNSGSANPFRRVCRLESTPVSSWTGAASQGIDAEWLPEATEAAEAGPSFTSVEIPVHKLAAAITCSFELLEDSSIAAQLPRLLADSFDRAEAAAFAIGSGSGAPLGVVTAVAAVTASRVATTTASTLGLPDLYKLHEALPPRSRASASLAYMCNVTIMNKIRQMDTTGSAAFWSDLNGATPEKLLGSPIMEASAMTGTISTGSNLIVAGSWEDMILVDRLGTILAYDGFVRGAQGRPTGQVQWFAHRRVGSAVGNAGAFRVLQS